jgi:hypothetical protein
MSITNSSPTSIFSPGAKPLVSLDTECYPNYWLLKLRRYDNGIEKSFEIYEGHPLNVDAVRFTLARCTTFGFNSNIYDKPMIAVALTGASNAELKRASDELIKTNIKPWEFYEQRNLLEPKFDHIDLIEVKPTKASLKTCGGKMHTRKLQDLPYEPDDWLEPAQQIDVSLYCSNDLGLNVELLNKFKQQIEIREVMSAQYGVDLRSKSDAQIAEVVLRTRLKQLLGGPVYRPDGVAPSFKYTPPSFLSNAGPVTTALVKAICADTFYINRGTGRVDTPPSLDDVQIVIGGKPYTVGIGGLHSNEKYTTVRFDPFVQIVDVDVASFYPSIKILTRLFPEHIGEAYLTVYKEIFDERIAAKNKATAAKKAGDKAAEKYWKTIADTLKIVLNGAFGKLSNIFSAIYSPKAFTHVTITGQLSQLMLIEDAAAWNIEVLSANTDGIVFRVPIEKRDVFDLVVKSWERRTGFITEETGYKMLCSRDVNSYIALKHDGTFKLKGEYAENEPVASSWPAPTFNICVKAVCEHLAHGTPIEKTVRECTDIREFTSMQAVGGGATWNGRYVGKTVRWYIARNGMPIHYKNVNPRSKTGTHNKVGLTDGEVPKGFAPIPGAGAVPCMELPDSLPHDISFDWYIARAQKILMDIGFTRM